MLLTYKIHLVPHLQQACAVFLRDSVANSGKPIPTLACLHSLHSPIQVTAKELKLLN
jgi:hypothetical protein